MTLDAGARLDGPADSLPGRGTMTEEELKRGIRQRLQSQSFAILSTMNENNPPHSTIVCFVHADDLSTLIFVTPSSTRKFANLIRNPQATLFIDDRTPYLSDLKDIWAIEAGGRVKIPEDRERQSYLDLFLRKYPDLSDFADSGSSALCLIEVESYDVVRRFQDVFRFVPGAP